MKSSHELGLRVSTRSALVSAGQAEINRPRLRLLVLEERRAQSWNTLDTSSVRELNGRRRPENRRCRWAGDLGKGGLIRTGCKNTHRRSLNCRRTVGEKEPRSQKAAYSHAESSSYQRLGLK